MTMDFSNITKEDISRAIQYIETNNVPIKHESSVNDLIVNGCKYPPKYVLAVAKHLVTGADIDSMEFTSNEAISFLQKLDYQVEKREVKNMIEVLCEKIENWLNNVNSITKNSNNEKNDNKWFIKGNKKDWFILTKDDVPKSKEYQSNGFMFEQKMCKLKWWARKDLNEDRGLTDSNTYDKAVEILCEICNKIGWNAEKAKAFKPTDQAGINIKIAPLSIEKEDIVVNEICDWIKNNFVRFEKILQQILDGIKNNISIETIKQQLLNEVEMESYTYLLLNNHNIILHGAPGTGKTYLAKKLAKSLIFGENKNSLSEEDEQKQFNEQCGFVQFHQSYDYTDFVEGLRPVNGDRNQIGFERKDGIFKKFCEKAICDSTIEKAIKNFKDKAKETGELEIKSIRSNTTFKIKITEQGAIAVNDSSTTVSKEPIKDYIKNSNYDKDHDTYAPGVAQYIIDNCIPKFVFIIDEINRGEMSKIFGELFYSVDPGYRGNEGSIRTQYANLQQEPNEFDKALGITVNKGMLEGKEVDLNKDNYGHFFVPKNVYIIGTMNDIDRSVESMDFAMRRRFAFKEITAEESQESMFSTAEQWKKSTKTDVIIDENLLDDIKNRMNNLNNAILNKDFNLNSSYQIGGAYFLKFANYCKTDASKKAESDQTDAFNSLWTNHLQCILREYLRGMDNVDGDDGLLKKLEKAYNLDPEYKYNEKGEKEPKT